jgi:rhodanese-related sulfurtransferase
MARIDTLLDEVREHIARFSVEEAHARWQAGALLVDIRPAAQRAQFGEVPGALIIERNVLEWRLDPSCDHRLPEASSHARGVIILCQEGYASSFAAASVRALGYQQAGDVIGGFAAWQRAGLPTAAVGG